MQESNLIATLQDLCRRDIQFIVVGGLAAVLNGAPGQTYDLDLVYSREPANIDRLLHFLRDIDAIFRIHPERQLRPTETHLAEEGHINLLTRYGPVDLLATIGQNLSFSDLLPHSNEMAIGDGISVRVLNLETLISIKEHLASEKDVAMLPVLRQTLRELNKKSAADLVIRTSPTNASFKGLGAPQFVRANSENAHIPAAFSQYPRPSLRACPR
jgi:predicted nucleotidyltransferase